MWRTFPCGFKACSLRGEVLACPGLHWRGLASRGLGGAGGLRGGIEIGQKDQENPQKPMKNEKDSRVVKGFWWGKRVRSCSLRALGHRMSICFFRTSSPTPWRCPKSSGACKSSFPCLKRCARPRLSHIGSHKRPRIPITYTSATI